MTVRKDPSPRLAGACPSPAGAGDLPEAKVRLAAGWMGVVEEKLIPLGQMGSGGKPIAKLTFGFGRGEVLHFTIFLTCYAKRRARKLARCPLALAQFFKNLK